MAERVIQQVEDDVLSVIRRQVNPPTLRVISALVPTQKPSTLLIAIENLMQRGKVTRRKGKGRAVVRYYIIEREVQANG